MAAARGASPAQVALAYLLTKPAVTSVIVGARKDEQLADNLGAAEVELSSEEVDRLDKVSAPDLLSPHWHQANLVSSRFGAADRALHGPARGQRRHRRHRRQRAGGASSRGRQRGGRGPRGEAPGRGRKPGRT